MKIYWWDEQGYGSWAFVLASSEEEAIKLLEASAVEEDKNKTFAFYKGNVDCFKRLKSMEVIEPGIVRWGEFA